MECPQCKAGTIRVQTTVGHTGDGGAATHPLICDNVDCLSWFHGVGMHMRSTTELAAKPERLEFDEGLTRRFKAYVDQHACLQSAHAGILQMLTVEAWYEAELAKGLYVPGESSSSAGFR